MITHRMESSEDLLCRMQGRPPGVSSELQGERWPKRLVQEVFRRRICIQIGMDFLPTLTPDEGLLLLLIGTLTLLACLGLAIWVVVR